MVKYVMTQLFTTCPVYRPQKKITQFTNNLKKIVAIYIVNFL